MKGNHNSASLASLPWWTWVLPFFIANLGTWLSVWFKTDPGASLWYLPTAFGIMMAYWWGPRVLLGIYLNAVICAPLWDLPWQWSFLYALPETIEVGLSWLFFIKIARGKCWLPDLRNVTWFLFYLDHWHQPSSPMSIWYYNFMFWEISPKIQFGETGE